MKRNFLIFFLYLIVLGGCKKNPQFLEWKELVEKGDKFFSEGEIYSALDYWKESLKIRKDITIFKKITATYITLNNLKESEKYVLLGLTYFPNDDNLLFNLALIKFYEGNYEKSLEILQKILSKNKFYPNLHYLKGLIYEKIGEKELAQKEFIEELNINPCSKKAWEKIKEMKNGN